MKVRQKREHRDVRGGTVAPGSRRRATAAALFAAVAAAVVATTLASGAAARHDASCGTVGILFPDVTAVRWDSQDGPFFVQAMKQYAPCAKVVSLNARGSAATQTSQAENMLTRGVKVLVVAAVDGKQAARIVLDAHKQHVPVVDYARPILNSPVDYFVTADVLGMGRIQGKFIAEHTKVGDNIAMIDGSRDDVNALIIHRGNMEHLGPLFASGKRKKVADTFTPAWDPAKAQQEMEQILTKTNNNVQAVLSANDGMASGVIAALRAHGLAGKVPVTGLDASIGGLQLVLRGEQAMSVLIPIKKTAVQAARITAALVQGKKPPASLFKGKTFNGQVHVPTTFIPVQLITKNNIDVVIKDGDLTKAQICKGVPKGVGPC
jgi:D-xylose transport system substrate-binding protein